MFKTILVYLITVLTMACIILLAANSEAAVLELEELNISYSKFAHPNRSAYFPQEQKDAIATESRTSILKYGFFSTNVHGTSDDSQYRLIGLKFDLGVRLGRIMDVYYEHHSQHLLDTSDYYGRGFFVEDSLNIKLYLYRK